MPTVIEHHPWVYYSTLVPGYVEKYSLRGMRERNTAYLKAIRRLRNPDKIEPYRRLLVENNLPLARFVAERYAYACQLSREEAEDVFQDCVLTLAEYIAEAGKEEFKDQKLFQHTIYLRMKSTAVYTRKIKTIENYCEFVPFDEERMSPEEEPVYGANAELLFRVLRMSLSQRQIDIIREFYLDGLELEVIGEKHMLTRERVRQIKNNAIDKAQEFLSKLFNQYNLDKDDFLVEIGLETPDTNTMETPGKPNTEQPTDKDISVPLPFRGLQAPTERLKNRLQKPYQD